MKDFLKRLKLNEGNLGMFLGVVVMVLAGFLLINYFRSINRVNQGQTSSASTEAAETTTPTETDQAMQQDGTIIEPRAGNEYVIQEGDSLWKISMKTYGTGYSWSNIYEANKSTLGENPSLLATGTRITLPEVQPVEHTVVAGDNLWNIALEYCGQGTLWETIASANNVQNPRVIEPGLVLRVSCR